MFANIGPVQLLIVLLIVLAIFGTKRLRTLGSDLR
jgi:sec-independent protein translocase protein TatA